MRAVSSPTGSMSTGITTNPRPAFTAGLSFRAAGVIANESPPPPLDPARGSFLLRRRTWQPIPTRTRPSPAGTAGRSFRCAG
jgi:hypothetical protein